MSSLGCDDKMTAIDDTTDLSFRTDADEFRKKKAITNRTDTRFVYDLATSQALGLAPLVAEFNSDGSLQTKYFYGSAGLLAMRQWEYTMQYEAVF